MTLVQQITFITFPLAALIAMFGGWFAYQLSLEHVRQEDDFNLNRFFLQVMVGLPVVLIFFIVIITNTTFEKLIQLGY